MPIHHILLLIACNAVWGFNFIAGKIGTAVFEPLLFSAIRFAFVLVLLAPFIRWVPGHVLAADQTCREFSHTVYHLIHRIRGWFFDLDLR